MTAGIESNAETSVKEQLERALQVNAELERFAYVAAHDLQEPARMVASYLRLFADKTGSDIDPALRSYLDFALDGAVRMRRMIDGLLAVAAVRASEPTTLQLVDLNEVLAEVRTLLALTVQETSAVIECGTLPSLPGERALLVQLFQNLLANSIKFRSASPPRIEIHCETSSPDEWLFQVRDNGIGLPMEQAERAFHLLQRIHSRKRYPGSGIGLALCKEVVERHGGRISLSSVVDQGTCVSFTLRNRAQDVK